MFSRLLVALLLAGLLLGSASPTHASGSRAYWYRCFVTFHGSVAVSRSCKQFPLRVQKTPLSYWKHCKTTGRQSLRLCVRYPEFVHKPPPPPPPPSVLLNGCIYPQVKVWAAQIAYASARTGLPANFIAAVIQIESAGNAYVNSTPNGYGGWDIGLMQFGPTEAALVGGPYTTEPGGNILTGSLFLAYLRDRYAGGNLFLVAAMYNGGVGGWANAEANGYPQRVWGWTIC